MKGAEDNQDFCPRQLEGTAVPPTEIAEGGVGRGEWVTSAILLGPR